MVRAALIVRDLAASRRFWEQAIGLTEIYWQGSMAGDVVERLLGGPPGMRCDAVILKAPGEAYGMVGLFSGADLPQDPPTRNGLRTGDAVLVFYCADLDPVMVAAPKFGGQIVCPPVAFVHEGRVKQRECTLRDPDGFAINLIEWDPSNPERPEHSKGRAL